MNKKIWLGLIILVVVLVFTGCDELFDDVPSWAIGKWYLAAETGVPAADSATRMTPIFEITKKQYIFPVGGVGVNVESIKGNTITFIGGQKIRKTDTLCEFHELKATAACTTALHSAPRPCATCKKNVKCVQIQASNVMGDWDDRHK